jgi:hypothetical protein
VIFLKPPTTANDIREFFNNFSEGLRAEYKEAFDRSLRGHTGVVADSAAYRSRSNNGSARRGLTAWILFEFR